MLTDLRQTHQYSTFLTLIGWKTMCIAGVYIYVKKIPLLGSAIKIQRTTIIPFKQISQIARKCRAFQIIIEPATGDTVSSLQKNGFKLSRQPFLPTKTLQISLRQTPNDIIENMTKDARYSLRKSAHIVTEQVHSIEDFRSKWKETVQNKRHVLSLHELYSLKKAFGEKMIIIMNEEKTAGGLFLLSDKTAYYWVGFTNEAARKTLAQYQIIWKGMLWAKKKRAHIFDFEGIFDERFPKKDWIGFTFFKRSFGGTEVTFPGCFVKWRLPI